MILKKYRPVVLLIVQTTKSISVQKQLSSVYNIELHIEKECIFPPQYVLKTNCEPEDDLIQVETCSSI
jgi:hypothetical protein